jgi:hypothetical protein
VIAPFFDLVAEGVNATVCHNAKRGFVVVIASWWVALKHQLTELIEHSELRAVFGKEW